MTTRANYQTALLSASATTNPPPLTVRAAPPPGATPPIFSGRCAVASNLLSAPSFPLYWIGHWRGPEIEIPPRLVPFVPAQNSPEESSLPISGAALLELGDHSSPKRSSCCREQRHGSPTGSSSPHHTVSQSWLSPCHRSWRRRHLHQQQGCSACSQDESHFST